MRYYLEPLALMECHGPKFLPSSPRKELSDSQPFGRKTQGWKGKSCSDTNQGDASRSRDFGKPALLKVVPCSVKTTNAKPHVMVKGK